MRTRNGTEREKKGRAEGSTVVSEPQGLEAKMLLGRSLARIKESGGGLRAV